MSTLNPVDVFRGVVKESHKRCIAHMGEAVGFSAGDLHFIVIANSIADLKKVSTMVQQEQIDTTKVHRVAIMQESSVELEDDEL
jgi:hypothetical protein